MGSLFRNSLLTSILRDSLGGNCLTTMLATISLASVNIEVRSAFLRFFNRKIVSFIAYFGIFCNS